MVCVCGGATGGGGGVCVCPGRGGGGAGIRWTGMILLRVSELVGYDSHGRAEKAEPDKAFSYICSNEFKILFLLVL